MAYWSAVVAAIVYCVVSVALRTVFCVDNVAMTGDAEPSYDCTIYVVLDLLDILGESLHVVPKG